MGVRVCSKQGLHLTLKPLATWFVSHILRLYFYDGLVHRYSLALLWPIDISGGKKKNQDQRIYLHVAGLRGSRKDMECFLLTAPCEHNSYWGGSRSGFCVRILPRSRAKQAGPFGGWWCDTGLISIRPRNRANWTQIESSFSYLLERASYTSNFKPCCLSLMWGMHLTTFSHSYITALFSYS